MVGITVHETPVLDFQDVHRLLAITQGGVIKSACLLNNLYKPNNKHVKCWTITCVTASEFYILVTSYATPGQDIVECTK